MAIPETAMLFPRLKSVVDAQIQRLDDRLQALGGHEAAGLKNAVSAVLGSSASTIDKMRNKARVSKMLRDDQSALSLMTISYEMLQATALGLGDETTAKVAQTALEELTPLVMEISRCVPAVVIRELRDEGLPVNTAAIEQARKNTEKAWQRQPAGSI